MFDLTNAMTKPLITQLSYIFYFKYLFIAFIVTYNINSSFKSSYFNQVGHDISRVVSDYTSQIRGARTKHRNKSTLVKLIKNVYGYFRKMKMVRVGKKSTPI